MNSDQTHRAVLTTRAGKELVARRLGLGDGPGLRRFNEHLGETSRFTFLPHSYDEETVGKYIARSQSDDAFPIAKVEELFVGYLLATCIVTEGKSTRPLLSGNSVHGDYRYVKRHMPRLDELLSFRLLDVTTIKELARRWVPKLVFNKTTETIKQWYPGGGIEVQGAAHDALYDIKGSIAELAFYKKTLFVH